MPKRTGDFNSWRLEKLSNPENAANYLNAALEDSPDVFLDAVKDVIQARTVSAVAKQAGVTRESLYRSFSASGNPTLDTLQSVLRALDLKISGVEPQVKASPSDATPNVVRSTVFRKNHRRRGVSGQRQSQLSLPFDASPTGVSAVVSSNVGAYANLARQGSGGFVLEYLLVVPDATPVSSMPGFFSHVAQQGLSAAALYR